jgi:hypothetical protein
MSPRFSARSEATQCHSQSSPRSQQPSELNASLGEQQLLKTRGEESGGIVVSANTNLTTS